jgi:uncharacterized protein DUF6335
MAERPKEREVLDAEDVERRYYESDELPSEEVTEMFTEAQQEGRRKSEVLEKLSRNPIGRPELAGGDLDAAWDRADEGEETVGGSSPTPDQDLVDEIGEALGLSYQDNEPLRIEEKLEKRDAQRWELNPASSEDYPERLDVSLEEADRARDDDQSKKT